MSAKALIVCTQGKDLQGHATGAWLEEIAGPFYKFTEAKFSVDFATPAGGEVPIDAGSIAGAMLTENDKKFQADAEAMKKLHSSAKLTNELALEYDIVFFAGGHGTVIDFPALGGIAATAYLAGKIVASVCHGPMVLTGAGFVDAAGVPIVKGKKVTGFSDEEEKMVGLQDKVPYLLEAKLKELGGNYSCGFAAWGSHAVADGNLITGQNPASSEAAAKLAIDAFKGAKLTVYYWPFLGRANGAIRMLEESGHPFELKSDMGDLAGELSAFGGMGDTFAPPLVIDGATKVAQTAAVTMYLGEKLGFNDGVQPAKAAQFMLDSADLQTELAKAGADAVTLKAFLQGADGKPARFANWMGNIERGIKGPYYFGAKATYVDFHLNGSFEWMEMTTFNPLKAKTGDLLVAYPKISAILQGIRGLASAKACKLSVGPDRFAIKPEVVEKY